MGNTLDVVEQLIRIDQVLDYIGTNDHIRAYSRSHRKIRFLPFPVRIPGPENLDIDRKLQA